MSWKETYRQWKQHENLDPFVHDELQILEKMKSSCKMLSTSHWSSEQPGCVV